MVHEDVIALLEQHGKAIFWENGTRITRHHKDLTERGRDKVISVIKELISEVEMLRKANLSCKTCYYQKSENCDYECASTHEYWRAK